MLVFLCCNEDQGSLTSFSELTAKASETGVPIHSVFFGSLPGKDDLEQLASNTGGVFFHAADVESLEETLRHLHDELSSVYALSFTPAIPTAKTVKLQVNNRGVLGEISRDVDIPRSPSTDLPQNRPAPLRRKVI